jgi:hypothetical protein
MRFLAFNARMIDEYWSLEDLEGVVGGLLEVLVKHLPSETEGITKKFNEVCQFPGGELVSQRRPVPTV